MTWMQTSLGIRFPLEYPCFTRITIGDLASALSKVCRFNGHTVGFYSVAEHSVIVSQNVPTEHRLWGLLHDAHEAYIGDIITPLKKVLFPRGERRDEFDALKKRYHSAVARRFGLYPDSPPPEVRAVDLRLLSDERAQVMTDMPESAAEWGNTAEPLGVNIRMLTPLDAEREFIDRYLWLEGQR